MAKRKQTPPPPILIVGESRSERAKKLGITFLTCAKSGRWQCCSRKLFSALLTLANQKGWKGFDLTKLMYVNVWNDQWQEDPKTLTKIQMIQQIEGALIIVLGRRTAFFLRDEKGIRDFIEVYHPAALGLLAIEANYIAHFVETLWDHC